MALEEVGRPQVATSLTAVTRLNTTTEDGRVEAPPERPKVHDWKSCVRETVPWVRIPPSPLIRLLFLLVRHSHAKGQFDGRSHLEF